MSETPKLFEIFPAGQKKGRKSDEKEICHKYSTKATLVADDFSRKTTVFNIYQLFSISYLF